jgi:energy-coupling factor transporter ATP-binding protein EcfA2
MTLEIKANPKPTSVIIDAVYVKTGVERHDGNPLIEALPKLPQRIIEFDNLVEYMPPKPTEKTRRQSEVVRMMEAMTLTDIVYAFPEYSKACQDIVTLMCEAYVSRNPLTAEDVRRRHALATGQRDGVRRPMNWKSHASGLLIIAATGMGKTTLLESLVLLLPQVIRHTKYHGIYVPTKYQVVCVYLRVPHNGTLSALCLQFFRKIDELLGTDYTREARGIRNIAAMVEMMNRVATAVSISFIVVDELQNLRNVRTEHADIVLNYFAELIEGLGIGVICLATPAVHGVLEKSVRNIRKISSESSVILPLMRKRDLENRGDSDPTWKTFCEVYWDYTYVKNKPRLSKDTMDVWHDVSAGNTAFAVSAFLLTQRHEIGRREIVDIDGLKRTAAVDMAFLQPAIAALRSGKKEQLMKFDDLLYGERYRQIQKLLGIECAQEDGADEVQEFEEIDEGIAKSEKRKQRRGKAKSAQNDWSKDIPMRDPLVL